MAIFSTTKLTRNYINFNIINLLNNKNVIVKNLYYVFKNIYHTKYTDFHSEIQKDCTTCHFTSKQNHPRLRASANQLNFVERIWERTTNPLLSSVPTNRKLIQKDTMGIVIWLVYSQLFNWHGLMYHYYARYVEGGKIWTVAEKLRFFPPLLSNVIENCINWQPVCFHSISEISEQFNMSTVLNFAIRKSLEDIDCIINNSDFSYYFPTNVLYFIFNLLTLINTFQKVGTTKVKWEIPDLKNKS